VGTGSGQTFNKGITRVVVSAANTCTTTTTQFDVTVVDDVKPLVVTKNITTYLNASGLATIIPSDVDNGSSDNCGPVTLSLLNTGTICATAVEGSSLTLTAPAGTVITAINFASYGSPTGTCGNFTIGTCHATSSMTTVESLALNRSSVTISATNGVFGDPCFGTPKRLYVSATYSGVGATNTFNCSNKGNNTVTLLVTDANGNVNSGTAVVTVVDNQAPVLANSNGGGGVVNLMKGVSSGGTASVVGWAGINGATQYGGSSIGTNCSEIWRPLGTLCDEAPNTNSQAISTKTNTNSGATWSSAGGAGIGVLVVDLGSVSSFNLAKVFQMFSDGKTTSIQGFYHPNTSSTAPLYNDAGWVQMFPETAVGAGVLSGNNVSSPTSISFNGTSSRYVRFYLKNNGSLGNSTWIEARSIKLFNSYDIVTNADPAACTAVVSYSIPVTDNCTGSLVSYSPASGSAFPTGSSVVNVLATDASGNTSNFSFNVTIIDNQVPTISCPSNINVIATSAAGAPVTYTTPLGSDNCASTTTRTAGPASGATFPIGVTTVIHKVTDAAGLTAECSFTVTVSGLAPVINCPANITVTNTPGQCGANVSFAATETVGIPASTITYSVAQGSFFTVGSKTVTATATNAVGSSSCTFTVTVTDTQFPVLVGVPADVTVECDAVPAAATVTATDNCTTSVPTFTETRTSGNCANNYTLTRTWSTTDASNNTTTATQVITVQDTKAPVLTVPTNISVPNDNNVCGATVTFAATATDNCSTPTITYSQNPGTVFAIGTTVVTVTAKDACGNPTVKSFTVTVSDTQFPVLVGVPADATVECDAVPAAATVTASDNCTTSIPSFTEVRTNGNCPNNYILTRTWSTTDASHNTTTQRQVITVQDTKAPVLSTAPADATENCDAIPAAAILTATDNCDGAPVVTYIQTSTQDANVSNVGHYNYTITRTWTATDACSNSSSKTQVITVHDVTAPVITCPASVTINCQDVTTPGGTNGVATATDNCAPVSISSSDVSTQDANANNSGHYNYTITRTWSARDVTGNHSECVQTITVQDVTKPVIVSCPSNVTQCNDLAGNILSFTFVATDNCSPLTTTYSITAPNGSIVNGTGNTITTGFAIGTSTINWTVKDVSGNTISCRTTVVVNQLPDFTISSVPTSSVYTGGNNNNLYLGYGAQSTKLQITHTAISGNESLTYTYLWSGNLNGTSMLSSTTIAAPIFTPTTSGYYTFTVVTTNNLGCSTTRTIHICVKDIRVPGTNGSKVYVCHVPPGNPGNAHTLSISVNAVPAHLGNHAGDRLGSCDQTPCAPPAVATTSTQSTEQAVTKETLVSSTEEELKVTVMPNPSTTYFTLKLESKYETPVNMRVMDASGRVVDAKSKIGSNSTFQIGHNYSSGTYYAEMIQGTKRKVVQLIKGRG